MVPLLLVTAVLGALIIALLVPVLRSRSSASAGSGAGAATAGAAAAAVSFPALGRPGPVWGWERGAAGGRCERQAIRGLALQRAAEREPPPAAAASCRRLLSRTKPSVHSLPPNPALQKGVAKKAEPVDSRDRCVILFGTQTGTAERFAKGLRAQLEGRYGGGTAFEALDVEQYDAAARLPKEKLVLLLMATYGDGDPTDSATEFWGWLSAAAEGGGEAEDLLSGVSFGVFGLGNRQYEHFCAMGKKVSTAMRALGAAEVVARGEGDDDKVGRACWGREGSA